MDYKKLIENCVTASDFFRMQDAVWLSTHMKQCETAITDLLIENQSLRNAANGFKDQAKKAEERAEKAEKQRNDLFQILNDLCKDVRAKSADEYVCGFCEYDGACIGENGEWLNECPGFEKDDCFCMKKSIREKYRQLED